MTGPSINLGLYDAKDCDLPLRYSAHFTRAYEMPSVDAALRSGTRK